MAKDNDRITLSPLALRLKQDLQLNGKEQATQDSYVRALRKFTEFLGRSPDNATEDDLRNYLLHVKNVKHWSPSTLNVAYNGLKFFFKKTCVVYALGLRLQETLHLQVSNIDSQRMLVHIHRGKGAKDRLIQLSTHTLRHGYATHLLKAGVNLRLTTTMIYLHVTTVGEEAALAKINALMKRKS